MMQKMLSPIEILLKKGEVDEAYKMCREELSTESGRNDATLWFQYGKTLWTLGRRNEAETAFRMAVELDPDSPARVALDMSEDIASFFNPDILNP